MKVYLKGNGVKEVPFCRKCGEVEVEKEGDLCVGCAAQKGGGNDESTTKEE